MKPAATFEHRAGAQTGQIGHETRPFRMQVLHDDTHVVGHVGQLLIERSDVEKRPIEIVWERCDGQCQRRPNGRMSTEAAQTLRPRLGNGTKTNR